MIFAFVFIRVWDSPYKSSIEDFGIELGWRSFKSIVYATIIWWLVHQLPRKRNSPASKYNNEYLGKTTSNRLGFYPELESMDAMCKGHDLLPLGGMSCHLIHVLESTRKHSQAVY